MRAAIYLRVSTREQAEHNYSLESQADKARAYAALHGHSIAEVYSDPGYSGTTDERPALGRLLADVAARLVDVVIVYRLDRLFRSQRLLHNALHLLDTHGVALVSVTESFDSATPIGRAMVGMLGTFAQLERDTFLERSRDGTRKAVASGKFSGGIVAYGYRYDAASRELVEAPEEADIVRRIFGWSADEGLTTYAVASRLNALGIPTKYQREGRGVRGKATANVWRPGRVLNMLHNPAYRGEWNYGKRNARAGRQGVGPLTAGRVPALVDPATWQRAQDTLARNATFNPRNGKREYLLSGLVRCQCGCAYAGCYYELADGSEVRYYRCSSRYERTRDGACGTPPLQATFVESLVWQDVANFLAQPEHVIAALRAVAPAPGADHAGELARVERRLAEVADAESRLLTLYTSASVSREALDREAARLEGERLAAQRLRAEIERERAGEAAERARLASVEAMLRELAGRLDAPSFDQRRQVIRALVERIEVGRDGDTPTVRVRYRFDRDGKGGVVAPRTGIRAGQNYAALTIERTLR